MLIHTVEETGRHAGHLDIIRERLDGATGYYEGSSNVAPDAGRSSP